MVHSLNRRTLLLSGVALAIDTQLGGCVLAEDPVGGVPVARREPRRIVQLGRTRIDEYAWLRDPDYQAVLKDPERLRPDIRAHLQAENAYSSRILRSTKNLQAQLAGEMRARIDPDETSAGQPDGPWLYFSRYSDGAQQPVFLRRPQGGGAEQVLFDADKAASGKEFFHLRETAHSPDHGVFVYSLDETGSEYYRIFLIDLARGKQLPGPPANTHGTFVISPDSQWLFWVARDENGRPAKVFRRPLRGSSADDQLVLHESDEGLSLTLSVSSDRFCIFIAARNQQTSETWFLPAEGPESQPTVIRRRQDGVLYSVERWRGEFLILTNENGAVDNKVLISASRGAGRFDWRELIGHQAGRYIADLAPFANYLVRLERVNAEDRIVVLREADLTEEVLTFEEEAFSLSLERGFEFATEKLRFLYQSPITPPQWWDYDMSTGRRRLVKQQNVPGYDSAQYVVRRLYATAPDGERIPVTASMKQGTVLDASAPLLLYGYGAYGLPVKAAFSNPNVCLLDRGWICATAHIRGGSEKGWGWFLDGRAFSKRNTFTDYIACAEHLCDAGYTQPGRILAYGRSAGGMLMGAVLNARPDLWAGVLAGVPFVDVLNTMSDTTLPLTPPEWPEWGNPLTDPEAYDYIASYSPYDNVRPAPYPPVLATCGLTDPRVTWWEPAKWIARLRANNAGQAPIMLHVDMTAGHLGAAGRYDALEDAALNHAFSIWAMARTAD